MYGPVTEKRLLNNHHNHLFQANSRFAIQYFLQSKKYSKCASFFDYLRPYVNKHLFIKKK